MALLIRRSRAAIKPLGWTLGWTFTLALWLPLSSYGQLDCSVTQFTDGVLTTFGSSSLSADEQWLAYYGNQVDGPGTGSDIYRANLANGEIENLTNSEALDWYPSIDRNGELVTFVSTADFSGANPDGNLEVFLIDTATRQFTQVTNTTGEPHYYPVLNEAGTRLTFITTNDLVGENPNGVAQYYLYDIDQAQLSQLTHLTSDSIRGGSANSTASLFVFGSSENLTGGNPDGNPEIFLLDIGSGHLTQITGTTTGENEAPNISEDGQRLVFRSSSRELVGMSNGTFIPVLHDRDSGTFAQLLDTGPSSIDARITPDGNRVLLEIDGTFSVYDIGTGVREVIVADGGASFFESTNHDGTLMTFRSIRDLTGGNPDFSPEIFLATCAVTSVFEDGFESGDTSSWSGSVGN